MLDMQGGTEGLCEVAFLQRMQKHWDRFEKDARRKKELEYLKEFKVNSTEGQVRRLFFAWKKCRVRSSTGVSRCMSPWAAVHRSWAIRKALTEGKGGKMKVYHSFCKHYVEKKGWSMLKADQHWQKRLADRSWRHGVDPEDTIASIWISGHTSHHQGSKLTNIARLSPSLFLSPSLSRSQRRRRKRRRRRRRRKRRRGSSSTSSSSSSSSSRSRSRRRSKSRSHGRACLRSA